MSNIYPSSNSYGGFYSQPYPTTGYQTQAYAQAPSSFGGWNGYDNSNSYGVPSFQGYGASQYGGQDPYASSYGASQYGGQDPYAMSNYGYGQQASDYSYGTPSSSNSYWAQEPTSSYSTYGAPIVNDYSRYYYEPSPPSYNYNSANDRVSGSFNKYNNFNFNVNYIRDNVFDFASAPTPTPTPVGSSSIKRTPERGLQATGRPTPVRASSVPAPAPAPLPDPGFLEGRFYNKHRFNGH